jgi:hypothetical integral membrane protein (TIGR02206 family)
MPSASVLALATAWSPFGRLTNWRQWQWLDEFASFSLFHLVTVAIFVGIMFAGCWVGKKLGVNSRQEIRLRTAIGILIIIFQTYSNIWWLMPERTAEHGLLNSFPLQLCDLAAYTAAIALITGHWGGRWRIFRTLLYFWGIGLSTQAFFTPVVPVGPAHTHYWLFWIGHTAIVGAAIYDLVVCGYRPRLPDLRNALAITIAYGLLIFLLNIAVGSNYAYIGNAHAGAPTLVDKLGPWPLRVFFLAGLVFVDYLILYLIWPIIGHLRPLPQATHQSEPRSGATAGEAPQSHPEPSAAR